MTAAGPGLTLGPAWVQAVKPALTRGRTAAWRLRSPQPAPGLRILFYHRVSDDRDVLAVSPRRFRAQMDLLAAAGHRVVDAVEAAALVGQDGIVGLCFDDGYRDVAENALPVLERHGFRASVFVITGVAGGETRLTWYARQPPMLGWSDIVALDRGSPFSFEAHTLTHPNLLALGDEAARREIEDSKAVLEDRLGRRVAGFCYPAGLFGARERALVAAAGFSVATSCEPGANRPGGDPLALRRIQVDARDRLADFRAKAQGAFDRPSALRGAYRRARLVPSDRGAALTAHVPLGRRAGREAVAGARRPRVLLAVTLAETGGAQTYVASLLSALTPEFDVTVAAHGDGFLREACATAGVGYVALRHVRRPLHPARDALGLLELLRLIRRERPDIVHVNSSKSGVLGRLAATLSGVPVRLFTVHGWAFKAHAGATATAYLWADRLMRPLTTTTICVADSERAAGLAAHTCAADRTVVIPNGVALDRPRRRHGDTVPVVLLAVGRLQEPKDFLTLLRAMVRLEGVRLRIAGDGPDRAALEAEIARLELCGAVEVLGERDDVPALLAAADVFVLATRSEGMPLSVLEAMAAELPVVASAVGGVPELVREGETGALVAPGDPEALARALAPLVADHGLRARLGRAGRERAEREFGLAAFRAAHVELYRASLARGPARLTADPVAG